MNNSPVETKVCVICDLPFTEWGNNAMPIKRGQCCNVCNTTIVFPRRLRNIYER